MIRNILTKTHNWLLLFFAILTIIIAVNGYGQGVSAVKHDLDSLSILVNQCYVDTCRFRILYDYFWQYAGYDHERVRETGEWAYQEIKNSKNLRLLADGYDLKGFLLEKDKKYDSAFIYFRKALVLSQKTGYTSRMRWCYYHIALIHAAKGDSDSALYYYQTLHRYHSDTASSPTNFDVFRQIAFLFNDKYNQPDSAEKYLNKMLLLSRELGDSQKEIVAHVTLMNFYYKTNQVKKLLETINIALVLAEKNNHEKAILNIYYMIGDMFLVNKKNHDIALLYYKKVLEICRPKYKQWEATILNDIGDLYLKTGNDSLAFVYVNEGFKIAQTMNLKHQLSESYRNLGKISKFRGRLQEAIDHFEVCYNTGCDKCSKVVFHQSLVDIADSYMELQNPDKALAYYKESLDLAQEFNANTEQAVSNLKLGNYYSIHNSGVAKSYYESALQQAKRSNNLRTIKDVADTLSSFYVKHFDYKAAYDYQLLSSTIGDSISEMENQSSLADWELKFEIEKINKENKLNEQLATDEIKRQKTYRNGALLITLLIIVLGSVVYLSYRRKKKDNMLIKKMSADLHQADEMKLRFFSNVSHELRTPLTLINAPLDILLKTASDTKQKEYLELIQTNGNKLTRLINQLLNLRKIDEKSIRLGLTKGNISSFIKEIVSSFEQIAFQNEIKLAFNSNIETSVIPFDPEKIETIITNLLTNAFKNTPKGGIISVNIASEDEFSESGAIRIIVNDTGKGIKSKDVDKIFTRFYSVSEELNNNYDAGSSGIGLSLVKELVLIHKGNISVESKKGEGTRFIIILPVDEKVYQNSEFIEMAPWINELKVYQDEKTADKLLNISFNADYRILVVEDNNDLRKFLKQEISEYAKVITATNGEEGYKLAEQELPDIILTDVMMPVMDGIELCKRLKTNVNTSHIPVIILSSKASVDSQIEGLNTGADDYIPKPFNLELLLTKINTVLKSREALRQLYRDKLSIIPAEITVTNADENILRKLIGIIEEKISEPDLSATILASEIGMSRSVLYAKLKEITGQSVNEFVRTVKLKKASLALIQNNKTVSEIAYMFGFNTPQYFTKCFKEEFGTTPKEFASKSFN